MHQTDQGLGNYPQATSNEKHCHGHSGGIHTD